MEILQVENLTKDYGHGRGIFDVSFKVKKGEVYGFLGPNGAGKTTTIRHIMGFSHPDKGKVLVNGLNSWDKSNVIQQDLGYLPGEIGLPESLTGTQFINMMANLRGIEDLSHTQYLIDKFELDPTGRLKSMSLGMKRKLAIVTAFMHDPSLLVLDEPTSGLDPIMQQTFIDYIKEEKEKGKTILLSSHIFSEIDATCDKISIIKEGKLISSFLADDLKNNQDKVFNIQFHYEEELVRFIDQIKENKDFTLHSLENVSNLIIEIGVNDQNITDLVSILVDFDIRSFSEVKFTLEDYFMQFYDNSRDPNRKVALNRGIY